MSIRSRSGKSDIVSDFVEEPQFSQSAPVGSLLYAPLATKRSAMGAMILTNDEAVQYTANDLKLLVALSSLATSAMDNAIVHERTVREEKTRANLLRQFSPKVAESLVSSQKPFQLDGSRVMPMTLLILTFAASLPRVQQWNPMRWYTF